MCGLGVPEVGVGRRCDRGPVGAGRGDRRQVPQLAGGKAIRAIGGLFSKGAEAAAEGTAESAGTAGAEGAAESAASSAEDSSAARAADEPSESAETESNCAGAPHSFAGSTRVLLANGKTKAIDQIKVGDEVKNAVPGVSGSETHKVERVIVTTTDHDFVDLKIAPKRPGRLTKAAVALAAGVAALAGTAGVLTTTFHHPFYDRTQAAFVEAKDLNPGDELQTATGTATVVAKRLYHATEVTYDLTIDGLHTYYVMVGATPVLVHNCGGGLRRLIGNLRNKANDTYIGRFITRRPMEPWRSNRALARELAGEPAPANATVRDLVDMQNGNGAI